VAFLVGTAVGGDDNRPETVLVRTINTANRRDRHSRRSEDAPGTDVVEKPKLAGSVTSGHESDNQHHGHAGESNGCNRFNPRLHNTWQVTSSDSASAICRPSVRIRFGGPPTDICVTRDAARIQQGRRAVGTGIIRATVVSHSTLVALDETVEARTVGNADFLPDPPPILRPDAVDIAVPVSKKEQQRWRFDHARTAHVVFVSGRASKWWLSPTKRPVDIDRAQAARDIDLTADELAKDLRGR